MHYAYQQVSHKQWLIPSFENKLRRIDVSARSLKTYLTYKVNIYSECSDPIGPMVWCVQ